MKSHVTSLLHITEGILQDVRLAYPEYQGVDRDFARLTQLVSKRGLGVFTLDLPALDSLLVQGLEAGRLPEKGFARTSIQNKVPRLFSGLWSRIFKQDLCLRDDVDTTALAFLRQLCCIGKKTEIPCSLPRIRETIKEFVDVESKLPIPTLKWGSANLDPDGVGYRLHLCDHLVPTLPLFPLNEDVQRRADQVLLARCQRVADIVAGDLGHFDAYSFTESRIADGRNPSLQHGPGAVADKKGRHIDKYDFLNWSDRLEAVFPYELFGKMASKEGRPMNAEHCSELICVPKTAKGPRLIAAEPSEHIWCQMVTKAMLEDAIRRSCISSSIDFKSQEKSSSLARRGSVDRSLATVDLSSASDRLSCFAVERLMRANCSLLAHINAARTSHIRIPKNLCRETSIIKLRKMATQGTAVTFPMQTVCFTIMAIAALCDSSDISKQTVARLSRQVRVFGDDIILPNTGYAALVRLMSLLNLKVNVSKSFSKGYFREACGGDFYKGDDVTPVKPKSLVLDGPASCQAVLDASNNLFEKGYWYASQTLKHRLDSNRTTRFGIRHLGAGSVGYSTYSVSNVVLPDPFELAKAVAEGRTPRLCQSTRTQLSHQCGFRGKIRWNRNLHRFEGLVAQLRVPVPGDRELNGYSALLKGVLGTPPDWFGFNRARSVREQNRSRTVMGSRWVALSHFLR